MLANILALAFTVILLVFMGYFMLGSLPLLVLKHDTPLDSRFIRNFFQLYYRAVPPAAIAASVAYAFAGHPAFSAGMAVLAFIVFQAKRTVLARMDGLREGMTPENADAIARFRGWHIRGMLLNVAQIVGVSLSLLALKV